MKCERPVCQRKPHMQFGPYVLCRKHTQEFQAFRLADLRAQGIDPIGHKPTERDLYRWVWRLAPNFAT